MRDQVRTLNIGNLVGVNVRPSLDTAESVPYLTHLDFSRAIRELTDVADYTVINLAKDTHASGIVQYYKNKQSLDKLLMGANKARVNELGKLAALEYERHLVASGGQEDYTTSMGRVYQRSSLISTLRPMLLFVSVDLSETSAIKLSDKADFIKNLVQSC